MELCSGTEVNVSSVVGLEETVSLVAVAFVDDSLDVV